MHACTFTAVFRMLKILHSLFGGRAIIDPGVGASDIPLLCILHNTALYLSYIVCFYCKQGMLL